MSEAKIKVIGDIEHVRLRPEMYIGSTYDCYHLMQEALDNALDELVANYANNVWLDHNSSGHYVIADDGRGIPIHDVDMPDGTIADSVIASCIKLHSGAKFDTEAYKTSIGLHGVGLVCINALSKYMNVSVKVKDKIWHYIFKEAEFIERQCFDSKDINVPWSTRIEFQVDQSYFTKLSIYTTRLVERLTLIESLYPSKNIIYNGTNIPTININDFIKQLLNIDTDANIYQLSYSSGYDQIKVFFTYDRTSNPGTIIRSDVNLNICEGPFHSTFTTLLINCVNELYNKDDKLTKSDITGYLRCYISLNIQEPKFDGQTKARMIKNITTLINGMKSVLISILKLQFFKEHFDAILESKSFKQAAKVLKKKKSRVSAENPLMDCIKIPGNTLYILEGDSAGGTLKQINDKQTEAIFPLSGKIMNTIDTSADKAVDSKKIKYLLEAIGVDLSQKNQEAFRYDKIKIICDGDSDGHHIVMLVTIALWKYAPNLIRNQQVIMIMPPLYGAVKNKEFIPIYDQTLLDNYINSGYNISRFKGLGEMNPAQLKVIVYDQPVEYVIKQPASDKEAAALYECITNTELKRRLCEDITNFNITKLFNQL